MASKKTMLPREARTGRFVLGRAAFEKFGALQAIKPPKKADPADSRTLV